MSKSKKKTYKSVDRYSVTTNNVLWPKSISCSSKSGVSNSFSVGDHIYIPGFYTSQTLLKKFKQSRLHISGPQTFLSGGTGNQLIKFRGTLATKFIPINGKRHYLKITTSPGNDLRDWCDVARNGADLPLPKKDHYFSRRNN